MIHVVIIIIIENQQKTKTKQKKFHGINMHDADHIQIHYESFNKKKKKINGHHYQMKR